MLKLREAFVTCDPCDVDRVYTTGRELAVNLNDEIMHTRLNMNVETYKFNLPGIAKDMDKDINIDPTKGIGNFIDYARPFEMEYSKSEVVDRLKNTPYNMMNALDKLMEYRNSLTREQVNNIYDKIKFLVDVCLAMIDGVKSNNANTPMTESAEENKSVEKPEHYISQLKEVVKAIREWYDKHEEYQKILEPRSKTIDKMEEYVRGALHRKYTLRIPMYKIENADSETRKTVEDKIIPDIQSIVDNFDSFALLSPDWGSDEDIHLYLTLKEPFGEKGDKKDRKEDSKEDIENRLNDPEYDSNSNKKITESIEIGTFLEFCTDPVPKICPNCGGKLGYVDGTSKFKCKHCDRVFGDPENSHVRARNESVESLDEGIGDWFRDKKARWKKWREEVREEKMRRKAAEEAERQRIASLYANVIYPADYKKVAVAAARMVNSYIKTSSYAAHLFDERPIISDITVNPPSYRFICAVLIGIPMSEDMQGGLGYFSLTNATNFYYDVLEPFEKFYRQNKWFEFECKGERTTGRLEENRYNIVVYAKLKFDYVELWQPEEHTMTEAIFGNKERKALPDSEFGIPETRSYPLNDERHIRAAIRMLGFCKPENKAKLCKNIAKKVREKGLEGKIMISEKSPNAKYFPGWMVKTKTNKGKNSTVNESVETYEPMNESSVIIFENGKLL